MEKDLDKNFFHMLSSAQLAFLGDSVFETHIRKTLVINDVFTSKKLSINADKFTNAIAQANIANILKFYFTEEETVIFKRGKNLKHKNYPKHAKPEEYRLASALECVFGYLYLKENVARIEELIKIIFDNIPIE